jgi:hypothetical protein
MPSRSARRDCNSKSPLVIVRQNAAPVAPIEDPRVSLAFVPIDILGGLIDAFHETIESQDAKCWEPLLKQVDDARGELFTRRGEWVRTLAGDGPGWAAHDLDSRYEAAERSIRYLALTLPRFVGVDWTSETLPDQVLAVFLAFTRASQDASRRLWAVADFVRAGCGSSTSEKPVYVTLDQIAALLGLSKKQVRRRMFKEGSGAPDPDREGGGGKKHWWVWDRIRPWLEKDFGQQFTHPPKHLHS